MPKFDTVRRIDNRNGNGKVQASPAGAVYSGDGMADTLDGFDASVTPAPSTIPASRSDGTLDPGWLPEQARSGEGATSFGGQVYVAPWVRLARAISPTDTTLLTNGAIHVVGDHAVLGHYRIGNEAITIIGGPSAQGSVYEYTISRGATPLAFPAGTTFVFNLGSDADGGYITMVSGDQQQALQAPHINLWAYEDGTAVRKVRLGLLSGLSAGEKALFPKVTDWARYSLYADDAFLKGQINATSGDISGTLDVGGRLQTLSGLGRAGVVMGENEIGYGITLQDSQGEPLFWAVSPYMEGGTVLSEVAVGIKAEGKRLLYLHKDPATDEYKLEIGVETLVDGQLQATNILAGTGTYPNAFTGMRFGAEGLQTFGTDFVEQVAIDVQDGRLYFGKREGWLGENGLTIDTRGLAQGLDELEHTINWIHQTNRTSDGGYPGAAIGSAAGQLFATVRRYLIDMPGGDVTPQAVDTFVEAGLFLEPGNQNTSYLYAQNVDLRGEVTAALQAGSSLNPARAVLTPDGRFTTGRLTVGGSALHVTDDGQTVSVGTNSNTGARLISLADDIPVFRGLRSDGQYFAIDVRRASETWLSSSGAIALLPAPGADGIGRVLPYSNPVGLGSAARKFWEVYAEKGHFGTLGSQTALAGQFYLTAKHATLAVGLEAENVIAYVREDDLAEGEFYRLEDTDGNHETIRINTVGTLTGDGWYEHEIERAQGADPDNETGLARQWYAGDVGVSLGGNLTDGYIRLWGADDLNPNTGPAIVVYQRDNDDAPGSVSERATFGNLNGFYGYEENIYGVAFGRYAGRWVSLDDAEGLRIMQGDTQRAVYREYTMIGAEAGNNVYITDTSLALRVGTTAYIEMDNSGDMDLTGTLAVATGGSITWAGGKGVADDTGLEHTEDANNYLYIKPDAAAFMLVTTNTAAAGIEIQSSTTSGIGLYAAGKAIGVHGTTEEETGIGVKAEGPIALQIVGGIVDGGSQRYTALADATADTDALNRQTGDGRYMLASNEANYLLAAGTRTGATSQAQAFTNGIVGPTWKPASDSTTALRLQNAAGGTTYLTVDTSGGWVSIGGTGIKMPVEGEIRSYSDVFWQGPRMTTSAGSEILRIVPSHRTVQIGADPLDRYSAYTLGVKPASNMPALGVVAYASQSVDLVRFVDKNSQNAYQLTYDNLHNFLGNMNVGGRVSGSLGFDRLQGAGLRYTTTFTSCASSSVAIFDGSHSTEAATKINAATSGVIEVSFNPYTGWTANTNTGFTYADGRLLITFFGTTNYASTITVELYRPSGGVDGWTTAYTTTTNTASAVLVSTGSATYVKKIKITLSHASQAVWVEGISYFVTRPDNIAEMQVIPRYADEDIVLAADSVTWKDTAWTDRVKLAYNVANGASAVAYMLDTTNALSTSGAKLTSWKNNGTEQTYIDRYGGLTVNDTGADSDTRIEGDTDANLVFVDASADKVGIGTNAPSAKLDINSDILRLRTAKTPASAGASGNAGDICWDSGYIYVCTATNTWVRAALATW